VRVFGNVSVLASRMVIESTKYHFLLSNQH